MQLAIAINFISPKVNDQEHVIQGVITHNS